jgi:mRNA interferase HigB
MRIVGNKLLNEFTHAHADLRKPAARWRNRLRTRDWESHADLKSTFSSLSVIDSERVVFNLKGNKYRLLAKVDYEEKWVGIIKIGTHAEYSKWNL